MLFRALPISATYSVVTYFILYTIVCYLYTQQGHDKRHMQQGQLLVMVCSHLLGRQQMWCSIQLEKTVHMYTKGAKGNGEQRKLIMMRELHP